MDRTETLRQTTTLPGSPQLWLGLLLVALWWTLAWGDFGALSHYYFFPLWVGYILVTDGLVHRKSGSSPLVRLGWRYPLVFVVSAPFWWFFELLNESLANWSYLTPWGYGWLGRGLIGSLSFSTVIPAVLTTAELIFTYASVTTNGRRFTFGKRKLIAFHLTGWLMLAAMLVRPEYLFPLCWISVFFIVEPLARFTGAVSVSSFLERGDWRAVTSLALAGLVCGWFWEMWNFLAMPKWVYSVPHVGFWRVWEMPLLGYGGYIPFAFEILAFYALVVALARRAVSPTPRHARDTEIDRDRGRFL